MTSWLGSVQAEGIEFVAVGTATHFWGAAGAGADLEYAVAKNLSVVLGVTLGAAFARPTFRTVDERGIFVSRARWPGAFAASELGLLVWLP